MKTELILSKAALARKAGGCFLSVRAQFARLTIRENYRKERTNLILGTALSIKGVPIRLTEERWEHIIEEKPYMDSYYEIMLEAVEKPDYILRGNAGALVAVLTLSRSKYLHAVYKEVSKDDGFIVTAFIARKLNKNRVIWQK